MQQRTVEMFWVWIYRLVVYVPLTPYISMLILLLVTRLLSRYFRTTE